MKRTSVSIIILAFAFSLSAQLPDNYKAHYASLAGKQGETLFDALAAIAAEGYQSHTYNDLWSYFQTTDATAEGKVWDMYSDCKFIFGTDQDTGSGSGVCSKYNREHSLPKSWFGGSTSNAPGNDLFHMYPTDKAVNNQRANYPFGECTYGSYLSPHALGKLGGSTLPSYSGTVFEPDDIYKGDFARSYFGMIVRYGKSFAFNQSDGGDVMFSNTNASITAANHYGLTDYSVEMLMRWHGMDAVSEKETNRNNAIQQTQGNRNPFIDCPVLAEYFWGEKAGEAVDLQDLIDCGCAEEQGEGSRLTDIPVFPSLTLTNANGHIMLECLPEGSSIAVFNASGLLTDMMATNSPEAEFTLTEGFYLIVVSANNRKRAMKVLVE